MYTCALNTTAIVSCQRSARVYECPSYYCTWLRFVHGGYDYSSECYVWTKRSQNVPKSSGLWYKLIFPDGQRGFVNGIHCTGPARRCQ
ncbi:unnamed protein product [Adineta ricciae]|uniref:Uncharacterized protein n=1 Tax=Adineta ricciae TaxID=249248 RepID=A0A813X5I3_ADIRI|nr:unnamed protein product [Adineta ricciae]